MGKKEENEQERGKRGEEERRKRVKGKIWENKKEDIGN